MRPVAVVGPTATGKSELALALAGALGGEVVNADAMQLYRGMDIGTAKTPHASRGGIPHYQIDVLAVTETASVAQYQRSAREDVEAVLARGGVPIIVGGSGLYVQALLDDLMFPPTDPSVRARWESALVDRGARALHGELDAVDAEAARNILASDGRRIVRALEVVELTGQPFSASAPTVGTPRWDTVIVGLDRDTVELDDRIETRTSTMFTAGFVEEVEGLVRVGLRAGVTARRALGYTQVLGVLDGTHSLDQAQRVTAAGTRRYARRQRSWFRRDRRVRWLDAADPRLTQRALQVVAGQSA